ncbi:MAG: tRNA uridine-5-carboxymethylaminomethyl(34) synthesis GTPase MnmE [Inquilinaceae bacterium]
MTADVQAGPTIFAPATAPGRAGIAVVRVSGPRASGALKAVAGRVPAARVATLAALRDPASGELLDRGLVVWFPGPGSVTGEDLAEFHIHGGRAVMAGLVEALAALPGLRPAEPGEFTRRGFENGKLDLTAAEAVADLIDAETAAQRRQALRQRDGALAALYEGWRDRLARVLAHLEADLDFPDEDLPDGVAAGVAPDIAAVRRAIEAHLADKGRGERLRDGIMVAILGPPNAGKSSLLNRIARREAAIVSTQAGTTRDVIETHLDLDGYPVILADTAGLRGAGDAIEEEGIRRALDRGRTADFRLIVIDGREWPRLGVDIAGFVDGDSLIVVNKTDLVDAGGLAPSPFGSTPVLPVSALSGAGIDALIARLTQAVADRFAGADVPLTRVRHRQALDACREALDRAEAAALPELMAEDVRLAVRAIGRITGRVDVEDLLDIIFRDFCVGK